MRSILLVGLLYECLNMLEASCQNTTKDKVERARPRPVLFKIVNLE